MIFRIGKKVCENAKKSWSSSDQIQMQLNNIYEPQTTTSMWRLDGSILAPGIPLQKPLFLQHYRLVCQRTEVRIPKLTFFYKAIIFSFLNIFLLHFFIIINNNNYLQKSLLRIFAKNQKKKPIPRSQPILNSQAPETTQVPGARCARSGTNGQAVVRSLQNFHGRFRTCLKPQINIYLRLKLF